ncbi:hydrogenase [Nitratifractor sp.]|uniref:NADH-quinone oxidoreductase subunit B family protein n=1 Tax=Nitratifractor sp. TaxID=2268144 RepID=UPI0025EE08A9|nr:hydrogenase [Nitratifractor sp.]
MFRYWQRRFKTGILTEKPELDARLAELRKRLQKGIAKHFAGSLSIRMVDSGSCNACEAECNALSNPYYDLERLGIHFVASPRHADVMLLSGVLTMNMLPHVLDAWEQIPEPKWCITLGDCPALKSPIERTFAVKGPVGEHLPVAYHIPGCPPSPEAILEGLVGFLETMEN